MVDTLAYYETNAERYFQETVNLDMSAFHERFLRQIPAGGWILDAGCGSGRDAKAFLEQGYRITAFDAAPRMASLASEHVGAKVTVRSFAQVQEVSCYDGVWACASLLHLPEVAIPSALARLWNSLKPGGCLYLSFKQGALERQEAGRWFTDADDVRMRGWLAALPECDDVTIWTTPNARPTNPDQAWLNVLATRRRFKSKKLVTGGPDPLFPHLCEAISRASDIDLAVSFIKTTGLRLLLPDLHAAVERGAAGDPSRVRIRVLTSDYLDITDPEALRLLLLLQEQGAEVRVFESGAGGFHIKAYLFAGFSDQGELRGTAFIGSSNISQQALKEGMEWNYRVDYPGDDGFLESRGRFEEIFLDSRTKPLTDAWIDQYETRRKPMTRPIAPGSQEREEPPAPTPVQIEAMEALIQTRKAGYQRGLVVLPTGMGKTWLAAFDASEFGARRVLFVAHREEILTQAAETFLRIRPAAKVGYYVGRQRDTAVDILCASVQTLGRHAHLERFAAAHFDYIVIDEFHHAAASTYRRLLNHFSPRFLLGLTATPDRTDGSDILSFCDDNLVYSQNLFDGIQAELLCPFHYYGIFDQEVDYRDIPWRNGKFNPDELSNKLATHARARHVLGEWRKHAQSRTLAFCVSTRHADFMADRFAQAGIPAVAVYRGSRASRGEAMEGLREGRIKVIFSVDLFNEGVDVPLIDTVMMLRPTESKVLFLQQLGRGLRLAEGKDKLVTLDFIGNHQSFLHKPQALLGIGASHHNLAEFARELEQGKLRLPEGCFVNYDLRLIDFLKSLDGEGLTKEYEALRQGLGRRPTLSEFYRSGVVISQVRKQYASWFELVSLMGDLDSAETDLLSRHKQFFLMLETTAMTRSYKMSLLEAFQELEGWMQPPTLEALAERSWKVLQRRRPLLADLPQAMRDLSDGQSSAWLRYWRDNPINAWIGGNVRTGDTPWFSVENDLFLPRFSLHPNEIERFSDMVQEIVDYRLAAYGARSSQAQEDDQSIQSKPIANSVPLLFFPNIRIACGHFKTGRSEGAEYRTLSEGHGRLDPARHFIARASGNSMNGGKNPIHDGDYLLLERITPSNAGSITGTVMVIERQDETGDDQYLLRVVAKAPDGQYILKATNPEYKDLVATDEMRTLARLRAVLDPIEMALGQSFKREAVPALFGDTFNPGNWNSGHVVLAHKKAHVLFVTLSKQGKAKEHQYLDQWIDDRTFAWQSQNSTSPSSKRGRDVIMHEQFGITIHLFVRQSKMAGDKAAAFVYHGPVRYQRHTGSEPMNVIFQLIHPPDDVK